MIDVQILPVTPTIWCLRRPSYLTCSYIVQTPSGVVLIDAGMDSEARDMLQALERIKVDPKLISGILLTHWHNDHAAGAQVLHEMSGAPVFYGREDQPFFTRQTARGGLRGKVSDIVPEWGLFVLAKGLLGEATPRAVSASETPRDGQCILDDFQVIATPGHTAGHLSFFYHPERALFAGDALAVIGGKVHYMARCVTPDLDTARRSMQHCLNLKPQILCPGHREPLTENVAERCAEMSEYIGRGGRWPLLG